jgi:hypothetical protein
VSDYDDDGVNDSPQRGIPLHERHQLCRDLAERKIRRTALARRYGVTAGAITHFAERHAREIDDIKAHLDDDFAGLWIADKQRRIEAYMAEYELLSTEFRSAHHQWSLARQSALRAVADELGQIPNKSQITLDGSVRHELVGVDLAEAFPDMPDTSEEQE